MSKTILVVDDLPMNRQCLMAVLGARGYRLLEAPDGVEALALIRAQRPDLIISDILMPAMDGYELVRQLRADPQIASTPVIFYTGAYDETEVQRLVDIGGAVSLVHKPASKKVLLRHIEAALKAAPQQPLPENWEEFDREHLR